VPGIGDPKVALAVEADQGMVDVGKRVVIVGAGLTGTETAVYLAREGHAVTQIDMLRLEDIDATIETSRNISSTIRYYAQEAGVVVHEQTRLLEITHNGVLVSDKDNEIREIPCDTVLLSVGVRARWEQVEELTGLAEQIYVVGDCNRKAGNVTKAVREAFYAAQNVR
jgi:pyruvate/2-oxoglutarate dehydrogenase complex dihydrolipoamide dehydrogenase (E3) component